MKNSATYEIQFKELPGKSIFPGLDSGHYQAAANNLSYTKERAEISSTHFRFRTTPRFSQCNKKNPLTSLDQIRWQNNSRGILELQTLNSSITGIKTH